MRVPIVATLVRRKRAGRWLFMPLTLGAAALPDNP